MSKGLARLFQGGSYQEGEHPFVVKQVAVAALQELIRKQQETLQPKPIEAQKTVAMDPLIIAAQEQAAQINQLAQQALTDALTKAKAVEDKAVFAAEEASQKIREEAYNEGLTRGTEEGYEEGVKKGDEEGLLRWSEEIARFQGLSASLLQEKQGYFNDQEALLVELSSRIAAKILVREIKTQPALVLDLVRLAVRRLAERQKVLISLNPEDLLKVKGSEVEAGLAGLGIKEISYLADETIIHGGVKVSSGLVSIDATLDGQLSEIVRSLLEEASHEG